MRVFLVFAHVSGLEDRDLYTRTPCNRLSRDNTRLLNNSIIGVELPAKDTTTPTVENQLCRWRRLTTKKPLRSKNPLQIQVTIYTFSRGHCENIFCNPLLWYILTYPRTFKLTCMYIYPNLCTRIHNTCMHTHTHIHSTLCILIYMAAYQYSD